MSAHVRSATELATSVADLLSQFVQPGPLGACYVCHGSSVWWLPDGWSDGVALCLHPKCADRFYVMEHDATPRDAVVPPPVGAYATQEVAAVDTEVPLARRLEWSRMSPRRWTVRAQTTYTAPTCPAGEAAARLLYRRWVAMAERDIRLDGAMVVSVALFDTSDELVDHWGSPMDLTGSRWPSLSFQQVWERCSGCATPLWPGCRVEIRIRERYCLACLRSQEDPADPRPEWPQDPPAPGQHLWPEHWRDDYKPRRIALPKGMRRR